jgi:sugar phosphate permease
MIFAYVDFIMQPCNRKLMTFLAFIVGVGLLYPLIMTGIFKLDLKTSLIVGPVYGIVGAVLWLVTSNVRERRRKK